MDLDVNNNIIGQGSVQGDWLTAFQGGTTNPVEGCDDGTGIPNDNNFDCCVYIGCNDDNTSTAIAPVPSNYGVHSNALGNVPVVNGAYANQYTSGIGIQTLNNGNNFGCKDQSSTAIIPDPADKSCCAYVGCPGVDPTGDPALKPVVGVAGLEVTGLKRACR